MNTLFNNNFWKNKKIFITGHTGFKGSWLCLLLNLLGAEITGYSLKPKTKKNLYEMANIKKFVKKSIIADVRDYKKLYQEINQSKAEIIFHLAAQALVVDSYKEPRETFETNVIGTLNILDIIKKIRKIKTSIIITSDKVYDVSKNKIYEESDFLRGLDPYSSSKVCCEHIFYSYKNSFFKKKSNQQIATVRAGNVIGGGDYSANRLIPDIFLSLARNKGIVIRNPNFTRPWQHVLEPLSGYINLAQKLYLNDQKTSSEEQNWNFGPEIKNCKTVKYIAEYITKRIRIKIRYNKKKNIKNYETNFLRLSNQKAKKFLKWKPRWSLDTTLNKIIEWNISIKNQDPRKVCETQIIDYFKS